MATQPTSPLPVVYFYEDENTGETARQCTFFENGKQNYFYLFVFTVS